MSLSKFFRKNKQAISFNRLEADEYRRISGMPRFETGRAILFGNAFDFVDAPTFLSSLSEIFDDEIYKLPAKSSGGVMIDCGANIGLASLYFKRQFPGSNVIAFEPDPNIFKALTINMQSQNVQNIDLRNEAIAHEEGEYDFFIEGGHSGMIVKKGILEKTVKVKTSRLKNILRKFDDILFLKIDIEGYEKYVIPDIADELHRVRYLFFEYHSLLNEPQILDKLLTLITRSGMKYYIKESAHKRYPFITREIFLNMDLILNVFCYRD